MGDVTIWGDSTLDKKILDYLRETGRTSEGNAAGPHTIRRAIKSPTVRIGIVRVIKRLDTLREEGKIKKINVGGYDKYFCDNGG